MPAARSLNLDPRDWLWATWRNIPPLPRPAAAPFDRDDCVRRLARVTSRNNGWQWVWSKAGISPSLSREEAGFWLITMTSVHRETTPEQLAQELASRELTGSVDAEAIVGRLFATGWHTHPDVVVPLANLLTLDQLLDLVVHPRPNPATVPHWRASWPSLQLLDGFRPLLLPFLTVDERGAARRVASDACATATWPASYYQPSAAHPLAAAVGESDQLLKLVESWPEDLYAQQVWHPHYHRPLDVIFGLDHPRLVELHTRRLKLRLARPEHVRGWLAHTEYGALDVIRDSVLALDNKEQAADRAAEFASVVAPEAAPHMLELMLSRAPQVARRWLDDHPFHTVAGLLPLAGERGGLPEAAADQLRRLVRRGHRDAVEAAISQLSPERAALARRIVLAEAAPLRPPFDDASTPEWLRSCLAEGPSRTKRARSSWVRASDLPDVAVGDHTLNDAQREALLDSLRRSTLEKPAALVSALRQRTDRASLDAYAWRLLELWQADGAPSREKWAMLALGLLGGDAAAIRLAPMIRAWPGEGQHARAVLGLECLRAIGTDTAIMQINGIAQKVKFKGLQAKAAACIEAVARDRGLSRGDLEDRIVPDCGLDERGSRVFNLGSRQLQFVLGPDMKPMLRDATSALRTDLPKPLVKDDPDLAATAWETPAAASRRSSSAAGASSSAASSPWPRTAARC